jgi:hypothetical protein
MAVLPATNELDHREPPRNCIYAPDRSLLSSLSSTRHNPDSDVLVDVAADRTEDIFESPNAPHWLHPKTGELIHRVRHLVSLVIPISIIESAIDRWPIESDLEPEVNRLSTRKS